MSSNTIDVSLAADTIIDALVEAKDAMDGGRKVSTDARIKGDSATIRGYALAAVAIRAMIDEGSWTSGKQAKNAVSASSALKSALEAKAKDHGIAGAKAKRVVERTAKIMERKEKAHIADVFAAAALSSDEVVKAFAKHDITKELHVDRHIKPKESNPALSIMKRINRLAGKDKREFITLLVDNDIIDPILAAAGTEAEREAARVSDPIGEVETTSKKAVVRRAAVESGKAQARSVPKSGTSKKGAASKAKAEAAVADPFAN
jgi:hypothetical protein